MSGLVKYRAATPAATLAELGDFRWLTVGPAGQPDVDIVLMAIPGPPVMDAATADQVRDLVGEVHDSLDALDAELRA